MAFTIRPPEELPKAEEVVFDRHSRLLSSSARKKDPSDPAKIKKSAFNSKLKDLKGPRAAVQKFVFHNIGLSASEIFLLKIFAAKSGH
jgi:hypothetical protein